MLSTAVSERSMRWSAATWWAARSASSRSWRALPAATSPTLEFARRAPRAGQRWGLRLARQPIADLSLWPAIRW